MKRLARIILFLLPFILASCGGEDPVPTPEDNTPTAISLSADSFNAPAAGGETSLTITAPSRPEISGTNEWVSVTDGPYNKDSFKQTVTVKVSENSSYEERSATLTIASAGVPSVSFAVKQAAAEKPVTPPDPEPGTGAGWEMSAKLGLGWNMGNHMDAFYNGTWAGDKFLFPAETIWGNDLATQATFDGVKKAGFNSVRIPVTWLKMIGDAPSYTIDVTWLNRVYEIVGYAEKAGLNVIINTHHDENHHSIVENGVDIDTRWQDVLAASKSSEVNAQIKEEITAVWTQIAEKFKDKGDWLIFEGFNEINDGGWGWSDAFRANPSKQCNVLNEWNQTFVDAVRATGGNNSTRWLGVPTYCASPDFASYFTLPSDPAGHVMLSVHFYDPYDYTIGTAQYTDWGHTGAAGKKAPGGDEDHVKQVFSNLTTNFVNKGIPVYIGEFGASMRSKSDTRAWKFFLYYLEYVVKAAKTYGMPCFVWDNGGSDAGQEQHGYINHGTGGYLGNSKEAVEAMVRARSTESDGYTLEYVYNSAPKF